MDKKNLTMQEKQMFWHEAAHTATEIRERLIELKIEDYHFVISDALIQKFEEIYLKGANRKEVL